MFGENIARDKIFWKKTHVPLRVSSNPEKLTISLTTFFTNQTSVAKLGRTTVRVLLASSSTCIVTEIIQLNWLNLTILSIWIYVVKIKKKLKSKGMNFSNWY